MANYMKGDDTYVCKRQPLTHTVTRSLTLFGSYHCSIAPAMSLHREDRRSLTGSTGEPLSLTTDMDIVWSVPFVPLNQKGVHRKRVPLFRTFAVDLLSFPPKLSGRFQYCVNILVKRFGTIHAFSCLVVLSVFAGWSYGHALCWIRVARNISTSSRSAMTATFKSSFCFANRSAFSISSCCWIFLRSRHRVAVLSVF